MLLSNGFTTDFNSDYIKDIHPVDIHPVGLLSQLVMCHQQTAEKDKVKE